MRVIPRDISDRVARTMQTAANNANPSADIWISRPNTALVTDAFLERQKIFDTPVTDASIAVCHPRFKADNTMAYIGYISDGKVRVKSTVLKTKMDEHVWLDEDFEEESEGENDDPTQFEIAYYKAREYVVSQKGMAYWTTTAPYHAIFSSPDPSRCTVCLFKSQPQELKDDSTYASYPYAISNIDTLLRVYTNGTIELVNATSMTISMDLVVWSNFNMTYKGTIVVEAKEPFGEPNGGSAVSLAFDGVMQMGADEKIEFITETKPWVFWVNNGALYGKKLGDTGAGIILAVANCIDVSAICATDSAVSSFNFGLIVFFVLAGTLYYRQLISGVWMDGVPVSYAPTNIVEIAAFRTWDHRVGVQMKTEDGKIHEIYTQYMGIGKRSTEHIDISTVKATGRFVPILHHDTSETEHVSIGDVTALGKSTWGLSSVPIKVENLDDGAGNYGFYVKIHLDYPVTNVDGTYTRFKMADSVGIKYICDDAYADDDGMSIVLRFMNFNLSEGNDLTVTYTAESPHILCPAANFNSFEYTFTPIGLKRPDIPVPEPVRGWVTATNGTGLAIEFTQDIIGPTVVNNEDNFTVSFHTYDFVPGGTLIDVTRTVTSIGVDGTDNRKLHLGFDSGVTNSLQNCVGEITVAYANGTIYGEGGPVADFEITFTPDDMEVKHNPNVETGHVEIGDVVAVGNLIEVVYHDTNDAENISIAEINAEGVLTHINDL